MSFHGCARLRVFVLRRFKVKGSSCSSHHFALPECSLAGNALLAVSAAHLRSGDVNAAYRWFIASHQSASRPSFQDRRAEWVSPLL